MKLYKQLTISIASKDRHEVIESTLQRLYDYGLCDCPLIIYDDGSSPALNPKDFWRFNRGRILRNEYAQGQAIVRNKIIHEAQTPYVLQLDDDSYPVRGSFQKAICQMEENDNCFALAFDLEEPRRDRAFYSTESGMGLLQVRSFIGCSVLINKERFQEVGGYAHWIERTVEEEELCLRALSIGYRVQFSQAVGIRHEVTDTGRDTSGILVRSIRNWTAVYIRHAPLLMMLWRLPRMGLYASMLDLRKFKLHMLRAYFYSLFDRQNWCSRAPMVFKIYRQFSKLKHPLSLFS